MKFGARIVVDTNVLASGIFWHGKPYQILNLWIHDQLSLFVNEPIFIEYDKTLRKIGINLGKERLAEEWMNLIFHNSELVRVDQSFKLCRDPDDDKFIDCAIAANAELIVSGDNDLLSVDHAFPNLHILSPAKSLSFLLSDN
jgi:putative PIN family toxin of toxin-antitoxin system